MYDSNTIVWEKWIDPFSIDDQIENIIGTTWNQGGGWKAGNIPGYIENNMVVLELDKVKVSHAIG